MMLCQFPLHQTFLLVCHFFYFKTHTKVNCNLFRRDRPVAAATSCSVHVQASCCSFACSSIRPCFLHGDSLYYLPRMNKLQRIRELEWAAKWSFAWWTLKACIPHVCSESGEIMGERCLLLRLRLFVFNNHLLNNISLGRQHSRFWIFCVGQIFLVHKNQQKKVFFSFFFPLPWQPPPHAPALIYLCNHYGRTKLNQRQSCAANWRSQFYF